MPRLFWCRSLLILALLLPSGCSTLLGFYDSASAGEAPEIYGGTAADILAIYGGILIRTEGPSECGPIATAFVVYGIIDLPLSFAMDTILLPITIPWNLYEMQRCSEPDGEDPSTVPPPPDDGETAARKEPPEPADSKSTTPNPTESPVSNDPEHKDPSE